MLFKPKTHTFFPYTLYPPRSPESAKKTPTPPTPTPEFTTPTYKLIHRKNSDIKDFAHLVECSDATRPDELVVEILVPLIKSAKDIDVDIHETKLLLSTDPKGR